MPAVLNALAVASRDWIGAAPTGAMLSAMRAFQSAALHDESLVRECAAQLGAQEPGAIAFIAVAFGALVERGVSAELTGPAVLEQLHAWLPYLPTPGKEKAAAPPTPDEAMRLARFQFLCQSAVTHLARLPGQRDAMAKDTALLARLDELNGCSHGAWWVREALTKSSGTLVLLHAPSATGLQVRYTNVSNCFHLFTLLQTAVGARLPGGRERAAVTSADQAWWRYGTASSSAADLRAGVRGEGLVREIPRVDGEPVILLWTPIEPAQEWDAAFLGPHLEAMPASASVERMLTPDESQAWLQKVGAGRPRRRWWRFGR